MTNSKLIYLDNNATTKVDEKVVEVMLPYFSQYYGNPSSIYKFGGRNSKAVQEARETIKDFFGAKNAKEIFFTASGSESANMAISANSRTESAFLLDLLVVAFRKRWMWATFWAAIEKTRKCCANSLPSASP